MRWYVLEEYPFIDLIISHSYLCQFVMVSW